MTKYFIITGSSKGIGAELSRQLLQENHHVIGISRTENEENLKVANDRQYRYDFISFDLSDITDITGLTDQIFRKIGKEDAESIALVNNAAVVTPLGPIDRCSVEDIVQNVHINFLSPALLTSTFLNQTREWDASRIVINISSGSGKQPAEGMSLYCSTKAAIDMFTQCVDLERESGSPAKIYSVNPGMVDTGMQAAARNAENDFPLKHFFKEANNDGKLQKSSEVAKKIIARYLIKR